MELYMTTSQLKLVEPISISSLDKDDEYSIPLDISDIINICREYNKLGWQIQNQIENILEFGIEESIKNGSLKQEYIPHIKDFLKSIGKNPYFGDAVYQADECIHNIKEYEERNKVNYQFN